MAKLARSAVPMFDIPLPRRLVGEQGGYVPLAYSEEASQLQGLIQDIIASWGRLGDPYFSAGPDDPFEYRSVPAVHRGSVPVRLRFRGRAPALPLDEA